jgi:micrococcal nuclease
MSCGDGRALPRHIYLNFGDVTISIDRKHVPAFPAAGIDVKGLAGKRVRVRGWIEWRSGPMIAVTHPADAPESGDAKPAPPPQTPPGL